MGGARGPSRRDWIRQVGATAVGLSLSCSDEPADSPDDLALALLEPSRDGFVIAAWARHARTATVEIAHGDRIEIGELTFDASTGSAALELEGLAADTEHLVTLVMANGLRSAPHRVRTAPADDDPRPVRIAISADVDPDPQFDTDLVEHLLAAEPELYVSLGDFPYTDNGPPAQTRAEYRERHVAVRQAPRVRRLLESVGVRAIYDDHEFRNNWDAAFVAAEAERYAAAIAVWDDFFPLRGGDLARGAEVRYRRWRWGQHLECFLLDVRRFRSANAAPDDAQKTMLGVAQRDWLVEGLRSSTATFKLVLTPVPLDFGSGDDGWHAFATERQIILDAVVDLPGVLVVSADQHFFASQVHAFGVREIQVGPFARGIPTLGTPPPGVEFRELDYNVGLVEAHPDRLVVTGVAPGARRFFEQAFTIEQLTPRR